MKASFHGNIKLSLTSMGKTMSPSLLLFIIRTNKFKTHVAHKLCISYFCIFPRPGHYISANLQNEQQVIKLQTIIRLLKEQSSLSLHRLLNLHDGN